MRACLLLLARMGVSWHGASLVWVGTRPLFKDAPFEQALAAETADRWIR